jgi:hypothetical protein
LCQQQGSDITGIFSSHLKHIILEKAAPFVGSAFFYYNPNFFKILSLYLFLQLLGKKIALGENSQDIATQIVMKQKKKFCLKYFNFN